MLRKSTQQDGFEKKLKRENNTTAREEKAALKKLNK